MYIFGERVWLHPRRARAPILDVIEKTARHLGEMRFLPDVQRVGNDHHSGPCFVKPVPG